MSTLLVSVQGTEYTVEIGEGRCRIQGSPDASVEEVSPGVYSIIEGGKSFRVLASADGESFVAQCGGAVGRVEVETPRTRLLKKFAGAGGAVARKAEICAPMPALVVSVAVRAGDTVQTGQGLVVLEAMKMENELKAPHAGIVKKVLVEKGKKVEKGELMLLFE